MVGVEVGGRSGGVLTVQSHLRDDARDDAGLVEHQTDPYDRAEHHQSLYDAELGHKVHHLDSLGYVKQRGYYECVTLSWTGIEVGLDCGTRVICQHPTCITL